MGEEASHAVLDDADALDRGAAAAAELAAQPDHLAPVGGGGRQALVGGEGPHLGERRCERPQGRERGAVELGIAREARRGEGQIMQRAAARMVVVERVRHGEQHGVDIVGDGPGRAALGIVREGAVEVAAVDRRDAGAGHGGRQVGGGQGDDAALHHGRVDLADEARQRDLPLVLVAVIAGHEEDGPAAAALHTRGRDAQRAVGRARHRMGQRQPAHLLAVLLVVDVGPDQARGHGRVSSRKLWLSCDARAGSRPAPDGSHGPHRARPIAAAAFRSCRPSAPRPARPACGNGRHWGSSRC